MKRTILMMVLGLLTATTFASQNKKLTKIRLVATTGYFDETTVYFDFGINPTYDYQQDAQKVLTPTPGIPVLYTLTSDNVPCITNGYGTLSQSEVIGLGFDVDSTATYTFGAAQINNFDNTSVFRLEDRQTGTFTDLRLKNYSVMLDANDAPTGRFFLHISYPLTLSTMPAGCDNDNGTIKLITDPTLTWNTLQLFDTNDVLAGVHDNVNGQVEFTGLKEGAYYMVFNYAGYTTTRDMQVEGSAITLDIATEFENVVAGQEVLFTSTAVNATDYLWDLGDGAQIGGVANPSFTYYIPGVYTVTTVASNMAGCRAQKQLTVTVSQATAVENTKKDILNVIVQGRNVVVNLSDQLTANAELQVFNILGQPTYQSIVTDLQTQIFMGDQPDGYYFVSLKNNGKTSTKKIYVSR